VDLTDGPIGSEAVDIDPTSTGGRDMSTGTTPALLAAVGHGTADFLDGARARRVPTAVYCGPDERSQDTSGRSHPC
jgi:hypothetical protein